MNKYIEKKLKEKSIHKYKIIETIEKGFLYKEVSGEKSYNITECNKISVIFKTNNGIAKFYLSGYESKEKIDSLLKNKEK